MTFVIVNWPIAHFLKAFAFGMDEPDGAIEITVSNIQGQVIDHFEILEQFSSGAFGHVHIARHVITDTYCAAKVIDLSEQTRETFTTMLHEVSVFMQVSHPSLCRLFHLSQVSYLLIFFMEFVPRGTLSAYVRQYDSGLPDSEVRRIFGQIFSALRHCHVYHFLVHRDLKLENILLTRRRAVKLIDFGFAYRIRGLASEQWASQGYAAPEIQLGVPYDQGIDIWSLGIVLHAIVVGRMPDLNGRSEITEMLSAELRDLIGRMLKREPKERIDIEGVCAHPWLKAPAAEAEQEGEGAVRVPAFSPAPGRDVTVLVSRTVKVRDGAEGNQSLTGRQRRASLT